MHRRRQRKLRIKEEFNYSNTSYIDSYEKDIINIAFIIPTTSNKRNYKNIEEIDFFNILYKSFLDNCERCKYRYSFYLGYDDDDEFYKNNIDNIKDYFNSFNNNDKIFLLEMKNLKGKVGEIWTNLAKEASKNNDFLYQLGDDIKLLNKGWEESFISYLKSVNYIGAVGPRDTNNQKLITQSFVHITHLIIFGYYFPPEIKNWYVDDWMNDIYPGKMLLTISVINKGGTPRYNIINDKDNFQKVLVRDKIKLKEWRDKFNILEKLYINYEDNKYIINNDKLYILSPRIKNNFYKLEGNINRLKNLNLNFLNHDCIIEDNDFKLIPVNNEYNSINIDKNFITEDDIVSYFHKKSSYILTRKCKKINNNCNFVILTGYDNILNNFFNNIYPNLTNSFILITIESDIINFKKEWLEKEKLIKWFSWNKNKEHKKLFAIPIGLNKIRHFNQISKIEKSENKEKLLLINFDISTHKERNKVLMKAKKEWPFASFENYSKKGNILFHNSFTDGGKIKAEQPYDGYYDLIKKYKFILSPQGTGLDCHRTWEALYLGIIPIVLKSGINELYDNLPILVLDSWDDLNEKLLIDTYEKFKNKQFNMEKITLKYWLEKINGPKINFITYANKKFECAKQRILKEAKDFGVFTSIKGYSPEDLDNDFSEKYKDILNMPRGGGYWIWKLNIIYQELKKIKDNDFILYTDSGCKLNKKGMKRFNEYIEMLENSNYGILSFQMKDQIEKKWTTKEIFNYFNINLDSNIANSGQLIATIYLIKKNNHSMNFIETILKILEKDRFLFTDKYNKNQESYFKDNRHDQSISSVYRKIHGSVVIPIDETFIFYSDREKGLDYPIWAIRSKK